MASIETDKEKEVLQALGHKIYFYYYDWKSWNQLFRIDEVTGDSARFDGKIWNEYGTKVARVWNIEFFQDLYGNE